MEQVDKKIPLTAPKKVRKTKRNMNIDPSELWKLFAPSEKSSTRSFNKNTVNKGARLFKKRSIGNCKLTNTTLYLFTRSFLLATIMQQKKQDQPKEGCKTIITEKQVYGMGSMFG
jgi:hypothetical protein